MSHLGSRISALVDGQLSVVETEKALAHVAGCPECCAELAASRAARRALASADEVAPTSDLTARLLSLAANADPCTGDPFAPPVRQSRDELASYGVASGGLGAGSWRAGGSLRGDVNHRRSSVRIAAGSMAGLGAVAAMLFVLGERPDVVPTVHPGVDLGLLSQAVTADPSARDGATGAAARPAVDDLEQSVPQTASWLRAHAWTFPSELPDGWSVTAVRWSGDDSSVLEVDVVGADGTSLVVTEQQGRLDTTALAGAPTDDVGGRQVHVLSYEPWHVVWQSGATVVQVVGSQSSPSAVTLVGAFPGGAYDDGVPARITRGWDTVTGALERP
ncbi:zf-HC2 domain-containing protein [Cellulomonas fengjieae]|uniref:Zf-HC2 domain-containing protein n=1 Tax=Cellulomonas fengjieae TaxID=2819978 RepID=A0ABS3SL41_9CELL|nr:zf-HC2 domain-containing protein [Cellulomonas fengjieae]MBO3086437.1 zf-HC2 domain-containing protein [Cellulomonas fengjieae]QVI66698.1 zf-HC2 domain-containing protein [Cellulomonas fengjieae]